MMRGEHWAKLESEQGVQGERGPPQMFLNDLALRVSILSAENSKLLLKYVTVTELYFQNSTQASQARKI